MYGVDELLLFPKAHNMTIERFQRIPCSYTDTLVVWSSRCCLTRLIGGERIDKYTPLLLGEACASSCALDQTTRRSILGMENLDRDVEAYFTDLGRNHDN